MRVQLTSRERECLTLAAMGKSSWAIGKIFSISESTVKFHIKNAARKLETGSRTVAAIKAAQLGIIKISHVSNAGAGKRRDAPGPMDVRKK